MTEERKPKLVFDQTDETAGPIQKPEAFNLDKFKSKQPDNLAGVETLLTGLPIHSLSEANDFVRLHPCEDTHWTPELCFVHVPIKGQKRDQLHLIVEELAERHLPKKRVQRFRLALATKPHDVFFLCKVPSRELDNSWNYTNLQACEQAKTLWTQATSEKAEGYERYKVSKAHDPDAFPNPKWPLQDIYELITVTLEGRMIEEANHPGLLRLVGAKQSLT